MIIPSFIPSVFQPINQKYLNKQMVIFHGISIAVKHIGTSAQVECDRLGGGSLNRIIAALYLN